MSEKGGKGFSLPTKTTPKSALKSTPASATARHGKDDNSAKSKRGRKVQFGMEGLPNLGFNFSSPKSDGKFAIPVGKGDWAKGGKGEKVVNGGKAPVAKEAKSLELRVEQELPENVKCLMDCEAANILEGIQEQMVMLSQDSTIKLPESFHLGLQYAKTRSYYTNPQSVRRVLEALSKYGVSYSEICVIANTCPETVDEVFALVRSLEAKKSRLSEPLKDVLDELGKLKKST
ncbi:PREDICTED: DNA-directed RNA polymerases IV and V subunit 4 isoform X1 [Theobroma cacao]|uniref:DNA-directed RNA polymerases IV and V subunit 4 isoform X1 n=3 Tax=Theobroma cacao TaxID=3641 RepID=A0AB32V2E1_THECC|nr:PREDICTED: DNA-directed RNA polymerases IV and V subunit 4 isoform X1 [Theobroma cacao]EOY29035.1 DNA-directed RNA polymerase II subunit rpb4, putative isoform 1 [Theobroma cacao]EOY29036.1 DNA-directed RNA polymerase II subunit rpb4, putative isoform 1 [Theobroma cacao]